MMQQERKRFLWQKRQVAEHKPKAGDAKMGSRGREEAGATEQVRMELGSVR